MTTDGSKQSSGGHPEIRGLGPADAPRIAEILEESPGAAPWSKETLAEFLSTGGSAWGAEVCRQVVGVLAGRVVVDEFEILNLAVLTVHRRLRLGTALIVCALDYARSCHCKRVHLEVRSSNSNAITLYARLGFVETGLRKQYYTQPFEDARLFMFPM